MTMKSATCADRNPNVVARAFKIGFSSREIAKKLVVLGSQYEHSQQPIYSESGTKS